MVQIKILPDSNRRSSAVTKNVELMLRQQLFNNSLLDFRRQVFSLQRVLGTVITIHSPTAKPCQGMELFLLNP
jgi:hypothetical protein